MATHPTIRLEISNTTANVNLSGGYSMSGAANSNSLTLDTVTSDKYISIVGAAAMNGSANGNNLTIKNSRFGNENNSSAAVFGLSRTMGLTRPITTRWRFPIQQFMISLL